MPYYSFLHDSISHIRLMSYANSHITIYVLYYSTLYNSKFHIYLMSYVDIVPHMPTYTSRSMCAVTLLYKTLYYIYISCHVYISYVHMTWEAPLNHRSLLQKSPIKENTFCKSRTMCFFTYLMYIWHLTSYVITIYISARLTHHELCTLRLLSICL